MADRSGSNNIMIKGRFVRVANKIDNGKAEIKDRRQSLHGDHSKSENGIERRKTIRRQEDVLVLLEIDDFNNIFNSQEAFYRMIKRTIDHQVVELVSETAEKEKLTDLEFGHKKVLIETRFKYRDKIKRLFLSKGLHCEMIKVGILNGKLLDHFDKKEILLSEETTTEKSIVEVPVETALKSFTSEQVISENENIVVKVFARCLDIVHPTEGDWEREAAKQTTIDLEHKVIFMSEKHFKNAKKISYKKLIDQVLEELIQKSFDLVQLQGESAKLEEKYRLTSDTSTMVAINRVKEKIRVVEDSPVIETIKMLYIYLGYFKDYLMASQKRGKIQNNLPKLAKNNKEAMNFQEINEVINFMSQALETIKRKKPENILLQLKKLDDLKKLLTEEIYFIQNIWYENLNGKKHIMSVYQKTRELVNI